MIGKDGPALPNRFSRYGALIRAQPKAGKALRQFSVRSLSHQFVGEMAAPEINTGHLKKFSSYVAKKLNQGVGTRALRRFGRNTKQNLLKGFVRARDKTVFRGNSRTASRNT